MDETTRRVVGKAPLVNPSVVWMNAEKDLRVIRGDSHIRVVVETFKNVDAMGQKYWSEKDLSVDDFKEVLNGMATKLFQYSKGYI